jgi:hypothetical protein
MRLTGGCGLAIVLALTFEFACSYQEGSNNSEDLYANIPFHPRLVSDQRGVTMTNTETAPYLDTRINIYVGWTKYTAQVGTLSPGESASREFGDFTNEKNEVFDPANQKAAHIEVQARYQGYEDHKDFPPP